MSIWMQYSYVGRIRLALYVSLLLVNVVVLALSTRVNQFQDFFFMADKFPFALSIATLVLLIPLLLVDFYLNNAFIARPPFEIAYLSVLTILWLAFNIFSTSRWRYVPLACSSIPSGFADEKVWCLDLQALKAFVWIEWAILFLGLALTTRYVVTQSIQGNKHVWSTALSRYSSRGTQKTHVRTSSFWDKGRVSAGWYNQMQQ